MKGSEPLLDQDCGTPYLRFVVIQLINKCINQHKNLPSAIAGESVKVFRWCSRTACPGDYTDFAAVVQGYAVTYFSEP